MSDQKPFVLGGSEGERYAAGPFDIRARVLGSQSGGRFEMYHLALGGGVTVDYHVHRTMDETIYVLEGEIEFNVCGETYTRPSGATAFVPMGLHHGFTNCSAGPSQVLLVFAPSRNQDEYFRGLQRLFGAATLDTEALKALQKQYDQELIPPGT